MINRDSPEQNNQEGQFDISAEKNLRGVCVVTHPLGAAGENATRSLLEVLATITSVSLITADLPGDSVIWDRHEVIELSDRGPGESILRAAIRFVWNQVRMCRAIASRDEEIVLFFGATSYLFPIAFAKLIGRTVVLEPRGDVPLTLRLQWEERLPSPVARALAGSVWLLERTGYWIADGIITYTSSMADELGLSRFESKLYPNGARYVNTDQFYPRVPYPEREMVVGFLGRLDEEKNVRTLAAAAKELPNDITFRFIGDGDLRSELEHDLAEKVADGTVEFTGWVDHNDVPHELSKLRLLVLASEPTEGLPTVILEAMACGTPVLATPVSGVPDVVRKGRTGYFITEYSQDSIATQIEKIILDEITCSISANCKELVDQNFRFSAAVSRYEKILEHI